jgi:hypothetical protein
MNQLLVRSRACWGYGRCICPSLVSTSEHRKSVLFTLQGLVEKSIDVSACRLILDVCREWVFARHDGFPTMREKAGLLAKMTCLEYKRFEEPIWPVSRILSSASTRSPACAKEDKTKKRDNPPASLSLSLTSDCPNARRSLLS